MVIVAAIMAITARLLTPLLNQHRSDFEVWASQLLHQPVSIGKVRADWRGYVPEFSFSQVVILDQKTRKPAFEIQEIKIGFQVFSSLWQRKIVPQDIILEGASITVLQDVAGAFSIKDLPVQKQEEFQSYALKDILAWVFFQPYLSLREFEVHVMLYQGEEKKLFLNKVSLANYDNRHKISSNFIVQQDIPTRIHSQIEWDGPLSDLAHAQGHAYFHLEGFSLPQWMKFKEFSMNKIVTGWHLRQGIGGADVWLDWKNLQIQEVQSVFQWYDLAFYSSFNQKTYVIPRLSGHVGWKMEGDKQIFAGTDLLIDFPDRLWPATSFYAVVSPQLEELHLGYVDLQNITPILLAHSDFPEVWRKNILTLNPSGALSNLILSWRKGLTDYLNMSASGTAQSLNVHAFQKIPGIRNFSGDIAWNGKSGMLNVDSHSLAVTWRSLFLEPLIFDQVSGRINFQIDAAGGWSFKVPELFVSNADLKAKAFLHMIFPVKGSPHIDLRGDFSLEKAVRVAHYLPAPILDPDFMGWMKRAFLNGRLDDGKVVLRGDLSDYPFDNKAKGIFKVSGNIKNMDLDYAPRWPVLRQFFGQALFSGRTVTVTMDSAVLLDVPLKNMSGTIPYIGDDKPQVLHVKGDIQTDLARVMDFIHQSPLEEKIGQEMSQVQLEGPTSLDLSLVVPLGAPKRTTVLGKMQLTQDQLILPDWNLQLEQLTGALRFTEDVIAAEELQGSLFGEPTLLQLSTVKASQKIPSFVKAKVTGKMDIARLSHALDLSLSRFLSGTTTYQMSLNLYPLNSLNNQVFLYSNLQGVSVNLPAPFGKDAAVNRDVFLDFDIQQKPQSLAHLKYGDLVDAKFRIVAEKDSRVIDIDSVPIQGRVRIAYPFDIKKPVQAQLEKLVISSGNKQTISPVDPQGIPPLVIRAKQFIYGNKNLGQLTLNTLPTSDGMIIQNFNLITPDYDFKSQGRWGVANKTQKSQLQGTLQSVHVGSLLDRFNIPMKNLVVNKGKAAFNLRWEGPPYGFSLANMSGEFSFNLEKGRIINLNESSNKKMDIGRMLSVFSLQTIPRRLSFDFSDLFEQGYSFDFVQGDFVLDHGDAFTKKDAIFEGPVARITAHGRIGLLTEDYDLLLSVSPYVTESLPLVAGALTLNPLVGAAAWLVNKVVLSKQVSKVITYHYTVTGPWKDPVWQASS